MRFRSSLPPARTSNPKQPRRLAARSGVATGLALASVLLLTSTAVASWVQGRTWAEGRTVRTLDGDTEVIDVWGDGTSAGQTIRNAGIQAMEVGRCHSAQATRNMNLLTYRKHVRLTAQHASASNLGRPVRFVDVLTSAGAVDVQLRQLAAGHVLPHVISPESARWRTYWTAAQKAAAAGKNLWDRDYCRSGPSQATPLKLWVSYDGDGASINGEYIRVLNRGSATLSLKGWSLRSAAQDSYFFPAWAVIKPHAFVTLYVGKGTRTATKFFWGASVARFSDVEKPGRHGSGGYLFDPHGDLRAHAMYPCLYACGDPRKSQLAMKVNYNPDGFDYPNGEYVAISLRPGITKPVDLSFTVLAINGNTHEFGAGTVIYPGERLVTRIGSGRSSRLLHYWGKPTPILTNTGGAVTLRTTETTRLVCSAWGNKRC